MVQRELGIQLDKTHQNSDWDGALTPELIEYAAKDVEVLLPLYEVLEAKIREAGLTYVAEIEHRTLPAVVWMSGNGVPIDAEGWKYHARKSEADAARLEDELNALAPEHPDGKAWNFGSHQQVRSAAKLLGVNLPNTRDETLALYAEEHKFNEVVSKDDRKLAKAVNFGLLYGMGAKWLQSYALRSYGVEMSPEEASLYRRRFFQAYPSLKRWHDEERRGWLRGHVETRTLTGRRRMDVERLTDRLNAPVQGTAADGLKLALALLWERKAECPGAVPVLVCHDEVVVECDADKGECWRRPWSTGWRNAN